MRYHDPELQHRLAAEYVLGSLHGQARRRFEKLLSQIPGLQAAVSAWAERLHPMAEDLEPVVPPANIWETIEQQTIGQPGEMWKNRTFWRGFGMAAVVVTLTLTVLFNFVPTATPQPQHVVFVTNTESQPVWVVQTRMKTHEFQIKTLIGTPMPKNKVCVLWLVWDDGMTQSVGVLADNVGETMMKLPKDMTRDAERAKIAVSLEKAGGDMDTPHGEIIFKGPWVEL